MNYEDQIEASIRLLHNEGRYRTFIDINVNAEIFLAFMETPKWRVRKNNCLAVMIIWDGAK